MINVLNNAINDAVKDVKDFFENSCIFDDPLVTVRFSFEDRHSTLHFRKSVLLNLPSLVEKLNSCNSLNPCDSRELKFHSIDPLLFTELLTCLLENIEIPRHLYKLAKRFRVPIPAEKRLNS